LLDDSALEYLTGKILAVVWQGIDLITYEVEVPYESSDENIL
jgi:hypothetical protein